MTTKQEQFETLQAMGFDPDPADYGMASAKGPMPRKGESSREFWERVAPDIYAKFNATKPKTESDE